MTTTQICRDCGEAFSGPATLRCPYVRDDSEHGFHAQPNPTPFNQRSITMTTKTDDSIRRAIIDVAGNDWDPETLDLAVDAVKRGDAQFLIEQAADSTEADRLIAIIGD